MGFSRQECWSVLPFPSPSVPPTTKWKGFPCEGWRNLSRKLKNQFWKARSETTYGRQACPGFLPEILTLSVVRSPRASTTGESKRSHQKLNAECARTLQLGRQRICLQCGRPGFNPWVAKILRREWLPTHSSIFAWNIPQTEEPGLQRVRHNSATHTHITNRSQQPCSDRTFKIPCSSFGCSMTFPHRPSFAQTSLLMTAVSSYLCGIPSPRLWLWETLQESRLAKHSLK